MKNTLKVMMVVCVLTLSAITNADDAHMPPPDNSTAPQTSKGSVQSLSKNPKERDSSAELNRIKGLEGRWTSTTSMFGKNDEKVYTEYEVTSGGSAVLEKIFPGTPNEMVSVYYDDNGKLAMTHYCMMRNRPTLKFASSTENSIKMDVKKIEGLKSKNDPSMGGSEIVFKDKNHFQTTCKANGKGKEHDKAMTMEWTRVK